MTLQSPNWTPSCYWLQPVPLLFYLNHTQKVIVYSIRLHFVCVRDVLASTPCRNRYSRNMFEVFSCIVPCFSVPIAVFLTDQSRIGQPYAAGNSHRHTPDSLSRATCMYDVTYRDNPALRAPQLCSWIVVNRAFQKIGITRQLTQMLMLSR